MKIIQLKIAYDVVTLTIFLRAPQNGVFVFRMVLTLSSDYQHECTSGSN